MNRCTETAQYTWTGETAHTIFHCQWPQGHTGDHYELTRAGSYAWPNIKLEAA